MINAFKNNRGYGIISNNNKFRTWEVNMKVQLRKRILAAGLTVMMSGSVIAMDAMPVFAEEQTNAVLAEEAN